MRRDNTACGDNPSVLLSQYQEGEVRKRLIPLWKAPTPPATVRGFIGSYTGRSKEDIGSCLVYKIYAEMLYELDVPALRELSTFTKREADFSPSGEEDFSLLTMTLYDDGPDIPSTRIDEIESHQLKESLDRVAPSSITDIPIARPSAPYRRLVTEELTLRSFRNMIKITKSLRETRSPFVSDRNTQAYR